MPCLISPAIKPVKARKQKNTPVVVNTFVKSSNKELEYESEVAANIHAIQKVSDGTSKNLVGFFQRKQY